MKIFTQESYLLSKESYAWSYCFSSFHIGARKHGIVR